MALRLLTAALMIKHHVALAAAVLAIACGGTASEQTAKPPVVETADSGTPNGACGDAQLRHSKTKAELLAAVDTFLSHVNEKGVSAYLDSPSTTSAHFQHVHVDLPIASDKDPRPAILDWLASVRGSPVTPVEYVRSPERSADFPVDGFVAGFARTRVFGTRLGDLPLEAIRVTMQANGKVWRISTVTINPTLFFATEADARLHATCTPTTPPPDPAIRTFTFRGTELEGCAEIGSYEYRPQLDDPIRWAGAPWGDGILWSASEAADGSLGWVPERGAQLTIAKSNYWDRIGYADCYCHEAKNTGFSLIVNAITGKILRYTAAINCVVC